MALMLENLKQRVRRLGESQVLGTSWGIRSPKAQRRSEIVELASEAIISDLAAHKAITHSQDVSPADQGSEGPAEEKAVKNDPEPGHR